MSQPRGRFEEFDYVTGVINFLIDHTIFMCSQKVIPKLKVQDH